MESNNTILIVDDQDSIIKSLKRIFLSESYVVVSAPNGPSALELINNIKDKNRIGLIISDQRMPNMTGVEFLEKASTIVPDSVRFILSGYSDKRVALSAINKGIVHRYLTKPWKNDEILLLVRQAFESPDKLKKLANSNIDESEYQDSNTMEKEIREFDQRSKDRALGRMAVHHGFITQEQLDASMTEMHLERQSGRNVALENILFEKGYISSDIMGKLVAATRRRLGKSFGAIAIRDYGVTHDDIEKCLTIQSKEFGDTSICRLLGDILVAERIITEDQKDSIIIDMTFSEKEELALDNNENSYSNKASVNETSNISKDSSDSVNNKLLLNKKKKKFFKQRALDKIFCKSAIRKNVITENEALKALEEQLLHFMKTYEIRFIKDILVDHSIMSKSQADAIANEILGDVSNLQNIQTPEINTSTSKDEIEQNQPNPQKIAIGQNNLFEVTLNDDEMEASIIINDDVPESMKAENLKSLLAEHQIVYGLADDIAIELFLRSGKKQKEPFIIAKGRAIKAGRNATIKYYFEDHRADFGRELDSGKFDYRERAEMANITQGTVLAEKIPLIPSVNGINVKGFEVTAPTPSDVTLDCGKGAEISKDGFFITATSNGRPDISLGGRVSVLPEIVIKGDVNFKTGNIKFSGDVVVQGSVLAGFSVAANNLTVNNDIEEAEVNVTNSLCVKNSVNDSKINVGGAVVAQIIKKSAIFARDDVVVHKEIIDSTIITSGKVIVSKGRIVASTIHAAKGIEAMNIGSEKSSPCHLFPGADNHAIDLVKTFTDKIASEQERLTKLESFKVQYEQTNWKHLTNLSELSKVQEQLASEKQTILKQINTTSTEAVKLQLIQAQTEIDKKILELDENINKLFEENDNAQNKINEIKLKIKDIESKIQFLLREKNGFDSWYEAQKKEARKKGVGVSVQGTIFSGTKINGTDCSITITSIIRNALIYQILNNENPANTFYEMKVDSLISKGSQPHVFRT